MDMNEDITTDQNARMTTEAASDWFNEQTLAAMATDPATQDMVFALQDNACTTLSAIIDKTATLLMQDAEHTLDKRMNAPLSAQQPGNLAAESTRRRQAWQKARELAEMLVIGALINKDNPAWDPADPSSCAKEGKGTLLSLIRFDPEGIDPHSALGT